MLKRDLAKQENITDDMWKRIGEKENDILDEKRNRIINQCCTYLC